MCKHHNATGIFRNHQQGMQSLARCWNLDFLTTKAAFGKKHHEQIPKNEKFELDVREEGNGFGN